MKLTMLLMTVACLQVAAKTFSQTRLTISEKKVPFKTILMDIQRETKYGFVLTSDINERIPKQSINMENATIVQILDACLKGLPFTYSIDDVEKLITIKEKPATSPPSPQVTNIVVRDISGRIVNEKEEGIAGASVQVDGSGKGAYTNDNGFFTIKDLTEETPILVVSFIGYEKMKIAWKDGLIVHLKVQAATLSDVAVSYSNGYQNIPKERATGSYAFIDNKTYNQQVSSNVLTRLPNITSGLYANNTGESQSTSSFFIRGISTIGSGTAPLIVLDNFPYAGNINNLNPNDIESITVLKDANAASVWGAKAGNGVIVITTKKAKFNQPFQIALNTNVTLVNKPDLKYNRAWLDANDFINVEQFLFSKNFYKSDLSSSSKKVLSPVVQALADAKNGLISQAEADARINAYRLLDNRDQLKQYFYARPINQQYSLAFSGGSQNINYYLSGGYDKSMSMQRGVDNNRQTIHTLTNFSAIKNLTVQVGLDYTHIKSNNNNIGLGSFGPDGGKSFYYPYAMLADVNGNPITLPKTYAQRFKDTAGSGKLLDWNYTPLNEYGNSENSSNSNDILLNLNLKYNFTKGLSLAVVYQYEKTTASGKAYNSRYSYYARNMINQYTQRGPNNTLVYPVPIGGILNQSYSDLTSNNFRPVLAYSTKWRNQHEINATAGMEINQVHTSSFTPYTTYGYNDSLLTFTSVNYAAANYPFFDGVGSNSSIPGSMSYGDITNRFVSYYANLAYTYKGRYTISGSAKKDQSNLFGVNTNNRGVPLWSVGGKWQLSDESFYKVKAIPTLALRTTFGFCGNVNQNMTALPVLVYGSNGADYTNLPYATVASVSNPDLRWEKDGQFNIGLDFATKGNRISGTIEYYNKTAVDLLALTPLDPNTGLDNVFRNSASLTTKGWDLSLRALIVDGGFKWDAQLLASKVSTRITKYLLETTNIGGIPSSGLNIFPIEGEDPYAIYAFRFAGLDPTTGDPQGYVNKQISKDYSSLVYPKSIDDLQKVGTNRPPYFGSLANTFSFKGFSLTAMLSGKFGYYFRRSTIYYSNLFNSWAGDIDFVNRWQKPGDELKTTVPSLSYPANSNRDRFYGLSTATVEKGDVIRLQYISLGYDFRPIRLGSYTLKKLNLYVYANNVGIVWRANHLNLDPDYPTGIPNPFSIAFGLRTTF